MQRAGRPWSSSRAVSFRVPIVKFLRSALRALGTFSFVGRSVKTYSSSSEFCAEGQEEAEPPNVARRKDRQTVAQSRERCVHLSFNG